MNHLGNIIRKELRELLTPSSIISVLMVIVIMAAVGSFMQSETESQSVLPEVGVIIEDTGTYGNLAQQWIEQYYDTDADKIVTLSASAENPGAIVSEMKDRGLVCAIVIHSDFTSQIEAKNPPTIDKYYIYSSSGIAGIESELVVDTLALLISENVSAQFISDHIDDPANTGFAVAPVAVQTHTEINGTICDGVSAYDISGTMMSQNLLMPLVIMIVIMMIGSIVISSMGNEKENKTLETLLTLPVTRTTIVTGKILAAAIAGLLYGIVYLVGMMFYTSGLTSGIEGAALNSYGLVLSGTDWALLATQVFLTIVCALGICMVLGAFVKNYKAAQTMTLPLCVLAMIPMFVIIFIGWNGLPSVGQGLMFAIPFTHPMMAMENLLFGKYTLVYGGIAYLAAFALMVILVTVRLYKSDILLTGLTQNSTVARLNKFEKRRNRGPRCQI